MIETPWAFIDPKAFRDMVEWYNSIYGNSKKDEVFKKYKQNLLKEK